MKLLQRLFGSSKRELDASQHYSIDDHPQAMSAITLIDANPKQVSYESTSSMEIVDGNMVSSESSESLSVWGD